MHHAKSKSHSHSLLASMTFAVLMFIAQGGVNRVHGQWATNGANINTTNTGNVGIGTTNPTTLQGGLSLGGKVVQIQSSGISQLDISAGGTGVAAFGFEVGNATVGRRLFQQAYDGANNVFKFRVLSESTGSITQDNVLVLKNDGNVGIGTAAPSSTLDIRGPAATSFANNPIISTLISTSAFGQDVGAGSNFGGTYNAAGAVTTFGYIGAVKENSTDGNYAGKLVFGTRASGSAGADMTRMTILSTGNVGVGTTNPNYKLVVGPDMGAGFSYPAMTVSRGAGQSASVIVGSSGSNAAEFGWDQVNTRAFVNAAGTSPIAFTQNFSNIRMFVNSSGNVGIGTTTPTKKLDVSGDINASGTITGGNIVAKYQDVAEWVESSQTLAAGTVVVLDHTESNQVIASSQAYDTRVAGVISLQPGIALGEEGENKVLVATTGRVKVRVDASGAPIHIGDLLVTGSKPGVAIKSQPVSIGGVHLHRPGTLIGKALEPLAKGTGEILVLLSLQ